MAVKQRKPAPVRGSEMHKLGEKFQQDRKRLIKALNDINKVIFAVGAPLGSPRYFKIRELCERNIKLVGGRVL